MLLKDHPLGGIIVLPLKFLTGTRTSEIERRRRFFNYFEVKCVTVFSNTEIEKYTPIVLEFFIKTQHTQIQQKLNVYIVNKMKTLETVWHINSQSHCDFIKESSPFHQKYTEATPPNKRIQIQIDTFDPSITDGFYLSKSNPITLSLEPLDSSRKLVVRGHLSNRLKRRVVEDFNSHMASWLNATDSLFITNIVINGNRETIIDITLAIELIRRIIWSYYKRDNY
jgi:hypothetical protein